MTVSPEKYLPEREDDYSFPATAEVQNIRSFFFPSLYKERERENESVGKNEF
jgi:hypothetical protein